MRDPAGFTSSAPASSSAASRTPPARRPVVLAIGGSDPTGGAGVQGDLKTLAGHDVYGAAVVTAVTVQNHRGVTAVSDVMPAVLSAQIEAVLAQVTPDAVKVGMLHTAAAARVVARGLAGLAAPIVVDPVLSASGGGALSEPGLTAALADALFPRAALVTPNLLEAATLLGRAIEPGREPEAAAALRAAWRSAAVLVKGGHAAGPLATDWLATAEGVVSLSLPRVATEHGHGSGCALASSIAARLSRGHPVLDAVRGAKAYVRRALLAATALGSGRGPVRHDVPADSAQGDKGADAVRVEAVPSR